MKKLVCVAFLSAISFLACTAQQNSEKLLRLLQSKQVISAKEADSLIAIENQIVPSKTFFMVDKVKVFGYAHIGYQNSDTTSLNNTYGVKCIFAIIDAKISKTMGFMIQSNVGPVPTLYEYYFEWTPQTYLRIKAGQMKVPLSMENLMSRSTVENITGSQTINNLVGGATDILGPVCGGGRDVGIQLAGSLLSYQKRYLLEYQVGVFNGNGINNLDNNNHKDVAGWLLLNATSKLKICTSIYVGEGLYKSKDLGDVNPTNHIRNRWAIGAEMDTKSIFGRVEYLHGKDGILEKQGIYGLFIAHLPQKIDLLGEVDTFDKNITAGNKKFTNYQVGINWNFFKRSRLQLHYVYRDNNFGRTENQIMSQLQIGF